MPASASTTPTGGKPKEILRRIPGLPPNAQAKALEIQKERERKESKDKDRKQKSAEKVQTVQIKESISAFDVMMKARFHQELDQGDLRDQLIPSHCSPAPWTSKFGQSILAETRRNSVGSSPYLERRSKRGSEQLSSPSSPPVENNQKKTKPGRKQRGLKSSNPIF